MEIGIQNIGTTLLHLHQHASKSLKSHFLPKYQLLPVTCHLIKLYIIFFNYHCYKNVY